MPVYAGDVTAQHFFRDSNPGAITFERGGGPFSFWSGRETGPKWPWRYDSQTQSDKSAPQPGTAARAAPLFRPGAPPEGIRDSGAAAAGDRRRADDLRAAA